jgi:hypothetical protein
MAWLVHPGTRFATSALLAALLVTAGVAVSPRAARAATVTVGISPPQTSANAGDPFDLAVTITSDVPTRGVQFGVTYDASVVQVSKVAEGGFYKDWAKANGAQSAIAIPFKPDNQKGAISPGGIVVLGGDPKAGPAGTGTLLTISFTSKPGTVAGSPIGINNFILSDTTGQTINGITMTGAKVLIGGAGPASVQAGVVQAAPTVPPTATLVFPNHDTPVPDAGSTAPSAATPPAPTTAPPTAAPTAAPLASPNANLAVAAPTANGQQAARPAAATAAPTLPAAASTPPPAAVPKLDSPTSNSPTAAPGIPTPVPVVVPVGSPGILIPWEAVGGFGGGLAAAGLVLYALRRPGD